MAPGSHSGFPTLQPCAAALAALLTAVLVSNPVAAEVFVERAIAVKGARISGLTTRQMMVNGIPSIGRSWLAAEKFGSYAQRTVQSVPQAHPLAPVVRLERASLSIVEFLPEGKVRVLSARPAGDGTSVWETHVAMADIVRQRREAGRGLAPGRDHPIVGAAEASRRVNVVEVLTPGYHYSAVYLSKSAPCTLIADRVARLRSLGATLEAQQRADDHCTAALTLRGRRVDLSAARPPRAADTELVVQTDLFPKLPAERSQ